MVVIFPFRDEDDYISCLALFLKYSVSTSKSQMFIEITNLGLKFVCLISAS